MDDQALPVPAKYEQYQCYLYGLYTNNGGIYIEQDATFYTYDRTVNDSIYSLEELFRHEYVHYLAARYLIEGDFGSLPMYEGDRMTDSTRDLRSTLQVVLRMMA
ncbi:collagenase [Candidatus Reidiella endopervernicosa]|uniref:Collagenase n=1 Tax=Candidatus Reidiella endopervernicosa TaxID=2738883 RepID=A0A6N0I1C8_9GAMM|nr:collagenase [Candidatus Reidiella endopervernicosa]